MSRRGFTLVETLIVIVVLAILAGVVFAFFRSIERARILVTENRIHTIRCEVKTYSKLKGHPPRALEDLAKSAAQPGMMKDGNFVDAWERPLQYSVNGTEFRVWSWGPDGIAGTADDIDYVKN
jgi:general secretion pathway protein G